jgi:hypothetical protein
VARREELATDVLVAVVQTRLIQRHRTREAAKDVRRRQTLARRRDRGLVPRDVEVAVGDQ